MKNFSKLCTPAKIYLVIAVISTILALLNGAAIIFSFWQLVFAFIWTFVLGWLCDKGYTTISWFLVLLPYILIAVGMFNTYYDNKEDNVQLTQGGFFEGLKGRGNNKKKCENYKKLAEKYCKSKKK
jgi:hypothetical protein